MIWPPRTLETPRLLLRPLRQDDAPAVFAYASDPEVTRWMAFRTHRELSEAETYARTSAEAWEKGAGHRPWALELRDGGLVIGAIGGDRARGTVTLGYVMARAFWGRGLMTEAVVAVRHAALADPGVWRVQALHDVENLASGRVLEKAGLRVEGVLRRFGVHPQAGPDPRDAVMRAIVRD
jgi:ribosomal-protein-alanine N-acetyltransferase